MKKDTKNIRNDIINKTYYYIYKNLEHKITLDELANHNSVSKFHYHRIIKELTGDTLSELITSIRLQKAANLILTNKHSTISEIANLCGYVSHSSFIKAFKKKYNYTPTQWKNGLNKEYSKELLKEFPNNRDFSNIQPQIKVCKELHCAYIRHKGYNKKVIQTWEKLHAVAYESGLSEYQDIALYHDNPSITPLEKCSYVACITVPSNFNSQISTFKILEGLHAVFHLDGVYGDVLNFIRYVYHYWLPNSGYEAKTIPAYTIYHKNHFVTGLKDFSLDLYVPIRVAY